jgi:hypothetical protein
LWPDYYDFLYHFCRLPIKPETFYNKTKTKISCYRLVGRCGQDVRQVLHHLSMVKASQQEERMGAEQASSCSYKVVPRAESGAVIFLYFF